MKKDLIEVTAKLRGRRILVLGDMIADVYLTGNISRISREAPVLVLEQASERVVAGGAGNVLSNIATLGGNAFAAGVLGFDGSAKGLKETLENFGVTTEGLFCDEKRLTITKTRIIAGGRATVSQQIVRIDKAAKQPLAAAFVSSLQQYLAKVLPGVDGVVLSDYGYGTVSPALRDYVLAECKKQGIVTIVDSRYDIKSFRGVSYVKQNDEELAAAVGYEIKDEEQLFAAGQELLQQLGAEGVLITRGEKGMVLFEKNGAVHNIPVTDKSEVYDVSGAGDTCVSAFILALAAGVEPVLAAELANFAAGIAVRKMGTATVTAAELQNVLEA